MRHLNLSAERTIIGCGRPAEDTAREFRIEVLSIGGQPDFHLHEKQMQGGEWGVGSVLRWLNSLVHFRADEKTVSNKTISFLLRVL